jgi:hypothetical protein
MLPKPFRAAELLDKVKEVLAEHPPKQDGEEFRVSTGLIKKTIINSL